MKTSHTPPFSSQGRKSSSGPSGGTRPPDGQSRAGTPPVEREARGTGATDSSGPRRPRDLLGELPDNCLHEILRALPPADLWAAIRTCKNPHRVFREDTSGLQARLLCEKLARCHTGKEVLVLLESKGAQSALPFLTSADLRCSGDTTVEEWQSVYRILGERCVGLRRLSLEARFGPLVPLPLAIQTITALVQSPIGSRLASLDLTNFWIVPEVARLLASWELPNLGSLDLSRSHLPDDESARLLASWTLPGLTSLNLRSIFANPTQWQHLAGWELSALTSLDLSGSPLGCNTHRPNGIHHLATWKLPQLASLNLQGCHIAPSWSVQSLVSWSLPNLVSLNLDHNSFGPEGARQLAFWRLPKLAHLDLSFNKIGDEGARRLARWKLPELVSLKLHQNLWSVRELASWSLPRLTSLDLCLNNFGNEAAKDLADWDLPSLTSLKLESNYSGVSSR